MLLVKFDNVCVDVEEGSDDVGVRAAAATTVPVRFTFHSGNGQQFISDSWWEVSGAGHWQTQRLLTFATPTAKLGQYVKREQLLEQLSY